MRAEFPAWWHIRYLLHCMHCSSLVRSVFFNTGHWLRLCPTRLHWKHTMLLIFPWSPLDFLHSVVQWFLKPQMLRAIRWAWTPKWGYGQRLQQAYTLGWRHTVWFIFRSPHSSMYLFGPIRTEVRVAVCLYSDCSPNSHSVARRPAQRQSMTPRLSGVAVVAHH